MTDRSTRDVVWGGYQPFDPGPAGLHSELSRRDARAAYDRLIAAIPDRLDQLRTLLELNGVEIDDLGAIDRWYVASVQKHATTPDRLESWWYAVGLDLGILFGELVIDASEGSLRWEMVDRPKSDDSYQRPVIRGYFGVHPDYHVDFEFIVAGYGYRTVHCMPAEPGFFENLLAGTMQNAPPSPSQ